MKQVIKKRIIEKYNIDTTPPLLTVLVDGNSLLKTSLVANKLNEDGKDYGAITNFFYQIGKIIALRDFNFCYVFFDGEQSGILRYNLYHPYKANRDKNYGAHSTETEYDKAINDYCKKVLAYHNGNKQEVKRGETDDERFEREKNVIIQMCEELFLRVYEADNVEGDDLIAYYVKNKKPNEKIVIISGDRDLTQLISDDVAVHAIQLKKTITPTNHIKEIGYTHENVLLKKIFCGDVSDNIKGIKGCGEKTFFELFPEATTKKLSIDDIINQAKIINEQRANEKKKPLKVCENIINSITDGEQGKDIYDINTKLIDLSQPLLTNEAKEMMDALMYAPLSKDDRSFTNLYKIVQENKMNELLEGDRFGNFFSVFNKLIDTEKRFEGYDN